jgi:hypothetical protein
MNITKGHSHELAKASVTDEVGQCEGVDRSTTNCQFEVLRDNREFAVDMERNVSQEAKPAIRQEAKSATRPCYLTHSDLRIRYQWFGLLLGFSYRLDSVRLKRGLHRLVESYTSLAGR